MNKMNKTNKTKRTIRRSKTNRRKTYRGGKFTHGVKKCSPVIQYEKLSGHIQKPYKWTMQSFRSGGCDMYIWKGDKQSPHIHIHAFHPLTRSEIATYDFTISEYGERNRKAYLPNMTDDGYKDVLEQMYAVLNKVVVHGKVAQGKTPKPLVNWQSPVGKPSDSKEKPTKKRVEKGISIGPFPQKLFEDDDAIQSPASQLLVESA